jgi:hypothetical protein
MGRLSLLMLERLSGDCRKIDGERGRPGGEGYTFPDGG